MNERLLREWVRNTLLYEQQREQSWAGQARAILSDINAAGGGYELQMPDKRRSAIRLLVPGIERDSPPQSIKDELVARGQDIVNVLTRLGYVDTSGGALAKIRSSVSGRYPSIALQTPDGKDFFVVLNPGFRLTGGGGNAGPGETELYEINDESPVFKEFAKKGGMTFDFAGFKIDNVIAVSKPQSVEGAGGEPKSDIDLKTKDGLIRLSLKEPKFPTYEGISERRLQHYPGFKEIADCAKQQLVVRLLDQGVVPTVVQNDGVTAVIEFDLVGEHAYDIPVEQQEQAVYGAAGTGGPVDYVVSVPAVASWSIPDPAVPIVNWTGYEFIASNKKGDKLPLTPPGATPVLLFRKETGKNVKGIVLKGTAGKTIIANVLKTRAAVAPLEQRKVLRGQTAGPAGICPSSETVDALFNSLPLKETVVESVLHKLIKEIGEEET